MTQTPPKNSDKPVMGKIEDIIMSQLDRGISPENISAKDSIFIDSSEENIAVAWQYGMKTTWVYNTQNKTNILPVK